MDLVSYGLQRRSQRFTSWGFQAKNSLNRLASQLLCIDECWAAHHSCAPIELYNWSTCHAMLCLVFCCHAWSVGMACITVGDQLCWPHFCIGCSIIEFQLIVLACTLLSITSGFLSIFKIGPPPERWQQIHDQVFNSGFIDVLRNMMLTTWYCAVVFIGSIILEQA